MAVHGIQPGKGKKDEAGVFLVQTVLGKTATDEKGKDLVGLSFLTAQRAAQRYFDRTGVFAAPVRN